MAERRACAAAAAQRHYVMRQPEHPPIALEYRSIPAAPRGMSKCGVVSVVLALLGVLGAVSVWAAAVRVREQPGQFYTRLDFDFQCVVALCVAGAGFVLAIIDWARRRRSFRYVWLGFALNGLLLLIVCVLVATT